MSDWIFIENGFDEEGVVTVSGRRAKSYIVVENAHTGHRAFILKKDLRTYIGKIKSPKGAYKAVIEGFYEVFP